MAKIIESVPNISEGKNKQIIESCVDQIRTTAGCTLLQYSSDPNHNRTVITYMGSPEAVEEASVKLANKAVELIDLTKHVGEHPRMGCVDVIPFIPIKETTVEECVALSKRVGERIAKEADLPVFLYEQSASASHRENLAAVRKGQFEGMAEKVKDPLWVPDFGGQRIHPTGGVVAVGARPPLVAFNINLNTSDVKIANKIAKIIRKAGGGLDNVRERILNGRYSIGEKIIEAPLANELRVSRTPIRQAFKKLESEGLVENIPNRGSFAKGFTKRDIQDIYEVRKALEALAIEWAVERISEDDISKLEEIVELMEFYTVKKNFEKIMEANKSFHETIYKASESRFMAQILRSYQDYVQQARRTTVYEKDYLVGIPVSYT